VAAIVGIGVTILASIAPALRATRIEPVAALREGAELPLTKTGRRLPKIGLAITVVGLAATAYGNFGSGMSFGERLPFIGLGSFLLFIGIALLSPKFVKPLAAVLGRPAQKIGGAPGVLASRNTVRKPGRTAATAAALMIGIALVTFVAVLAASVKDTAERSLRAQVSSSDYAISASDNWSPITSEATNAAKSAAGVTAVQGIREDTVKVGKAKVRVDGVNAGQINEVVRYQWKTGSSDDALGQLDGNGAILLDDYAKKHHYKVGSPITLTATASPSSRVARYPS
jgi:putative ABC transport system permease protein